MTDKFIPGPKEDGLSKPNFTGETIPIPDEIRLESDMLRRTAKESEEQREVFAQEGDTQRVMELSSSGNMKSILKEFSEAQFAHGAATMNIKNIGDEGEVMTRHMTIRFWGTAMMPCQACFRVRERTWFVADQGFVNECPGHCGVAIRPLTLKWQLILSHLKTVWAKKYGLLITGGHGTF